MHKLSLKGWKLRQVSYTSETVLQEIKDYKKLDSKTLFKLSLGIMEFNPLFVLDKQLQWNHTGKESAMFGQPWLNNKILSSYNKQNQWIHRRVKILLIVSNPSLNANVNNFLQFSVIFLIVVSLCVCLCFVWRKSFLNKIWKQGNLH